jgi:hypothetical protein
VAASLEYVEFCVVRGKKLNANSIRTLNAEISQRNFYLKKFGSVATCDEAAKRSLPANYELTSIKAR